MHFHKLVLYLLASYWISLPVWTNSRPHILCNAFLDLKLLLGQLTGIFTSKIVRFIFCRQLWQEVLLRQCCVISDVLQSEHLIMHLNLLKCNRTRS